MKNPYDVLGISHNATEEQIKKKYKEMALKWHPDRHHGEKNAEEKFKEINGAYETLKSNNWKYSDFQGNGFSFNIPNFEDLFNQTFNSRFSFRSRQKFNKIILEISFEEGYSGCNKKFTYQRVSRCKTCNGIGRIILDSDCKNCNGTGQTSYVRGAITINTTCQKCNGIGKEFGNICNDCSGLGRKTEKRNVNINIPPGVIPNHIIRIPTEELEVRIVYKQHKEYKFVNEFEIMSEKTIDIFTAILGGELKVSTLSGNKIMKIKPGTQCNTIMKISNAGIKWMNGKIGDHLVYLNIEIPKDLNDEQKTLFEKLKCLEESNNEQGK